jgi:hypothetical protein
MYIVAWTYEADIHCNKLAEERFGWKALHDGTAIDNEGNSVQPIFDTDEYELPLVCGDDLEIIEE